MANYIKVAEDADVLETTDVDASSYRQVKTDTFDWLPDENNECRMFSMCRGIFQKAFLTSNGLCFNENVIMKEDALLYYEFGMVNPQIVKCEFPCYCVRQRRSSAMHGIDEKKAKKYFRSSLALADAYQRHLANQNFRDRNELVALIEVEKEQLVKFLLRISDKVFVKEQFKLLKSKGLYPYKVKSGKSAGVYKVIDRLLPTPVGFWLVYDLFRIKGKRDL